MLATLCVCGGGVCHRDIVESAMCSDRVSVRDAVSICGDANNGNRAWLLIDLVHCYIIFCNGCCGYSRNTATLSGGRHGY